MELKVKPIALNSVAAALSKAERYRYLNQPEEAESICQDILAVEPANQQAVRLCGLTITDQFTGESGDRYAEAEKLFLSLADAYERAYYEGVLLERRAKMQLRAGYSTHIIRPVFEHAMRCFEAAQKIKPEGNDDSILRWNRCVRLLQNLPLDKWEEEGEGFDAGDSAPHRQ